MKKITLAMACLLLCGCETIGNWADDLGQHLPVLADERCEHWQCFTEGGQQQSEYNKMQMQQRWEQEKLEDEAEASGESLPQSPAVPAQVEWTPAMEEQYARYYYQQLDAGQTPMTREQYKQHLQQQQAAPQPKKTQESPSTSGYRPSAEMDPWNNYQP